MDLLGGAQIRLAPVWEWQDAQKCATHPQVLAFLEQKEAERAFFVGSAGPVANIL
jgi:hypothetical protein